MFLECDYDGKFLFVDDNLKKRFGYLNEEFINSNRLFNLLHSDSVIEFIDFYNLLLKNKSNSVKCNFIFIGPNFKKINCLVLFEKVDNKIKLNFLSIDNFFLSKKNFISVVKEFLFLTRAKFVIGSLMPFFLAVPWCFLRYNNIPAFLLLLCFLSLILLHMAANTFNDYFDWKSGRDKKNHDYVLFSTGGSRSIDFNIISEKKMLHVSYFFIFLIFIISFYFIYLRGFFILFIGILALVSIYFYSAPPVHLASRYGLGELMHIICLGPLIIYGTVYTVVGLNDYLDFLIGIPHGLLITSCLLINEVPDSKSDMLSGKKNLAVVLGFKYIPLVYSSLLFCSFFFILLMCVLFKISYFFLLSFILLPYVFFTCKYVYKISFYDRISLQLSCIKSLNIYIYYSILVVISCILVIFFNP
ncbi:MAG TPA: UbiA family prenyltransferase [Candidatus Azoamicus sp.]